jgi:hypothetical protein
LHSVYNEKEQQNAIKLREGDKTHIKFKDAKTDAVSRV